MILWLIFIRYFIFLSSIGAASDTNKGLYSEELYVMLTGQQEHQIKTWIVAFLAIVAVFFLFKLLGFDELTQRHPPLYNAESRADVVNAYTHAQAYFSDYPSGEVTEDVLVNYGFHHNYKRQRGKSSPLQIINGIKESLIIVIDRPEATVRYKIDHLGSVESEEKN